MTPAGHASRGLALCGALSGFDDLSERFVVAALDDLERRSGPTLVETLLATFEARGAAAVAADPALQPHVRSLVTFLYTGFGPGGLPDDTPENHFESLMWRAALAHPPALSGGYFGHWAYPPDEANR